MQVVLPSQAIQNGFERIILPIDQLIDVLSCKNANLRQTRDLLLPRLISGELDVSELDITGVSHDDF
jgi:type I restriction enzyme S subunit